MKQSSFDLNLSMRYIRKQGVLQQMDTVVAMEEAFFYIPLYRKFAQLSAFGRLPDESTIPRFRHRLEKHKLADQILSTLNELLGLRCLLLRSSRQGGAPFSSDQAPVRICESALPRAEQEYLAVQDAVCAVKSVDGTSQTGEGVSMIAPESLQRLRQMGQIGCGFRYELSQIARNIMKQKNR